MEIGIVSRNGEKKEKKIEVHHSTCTILEVLSVPQLKKELRRCSQR